LAKPTNAQAGKGQDSGALINKQRELGSCIFNHTQDETIFNHQHILKQETSQRKPIDSL
jgi:hypothetical protein